MVSVNLLQLMKVPKRGFMTLDSFGAFVFGQIRVTQAKDTGKIVTSASENVGGQV